VPHLLSRLLKVAVPQGGARRSPAASGPALVHENEHPPHPLGESRPRRRTGVAAYGDCPIADPRARPTLAYAWHRCIKKKTQVLWCGEKKTPRVCAASPARRGGRLDPACLEFAWANAMWARGYQLDHLVPSRHSPIATVVIGHRGSRDDSPQASTPSSAIGFEASDERRTLRTCADIWLNSLPGCQSVTPTACRGRQCLKPRTSRLLIPPICQTASIAFSPQARALVGPDPRVRRKGEARCCPKKVM